MKVLLTGGHGFIGHNVTRKLCDQNVQCTVVDTHTCYGVIPAVELDYLMRERQYRILGQTVHHLTDICCETGMRQVFDDTAPDTVIHLASFPRQQVVNAHPRAGARVMIEGLINLLDLAAEYRVSRFVYISSSMVYGDFADGVQEHAPCQPRGSYGIMKLTGEQLVRDRTRSHGIAHTILRPSAVYGPWDVEDRVISRFLLAAHRGQALQVRGAQERLDFTHVDDVAQGIVQAVLTDRTENRTYNVTRSQAWTLLDAARLVIDTVGRGTIECVDKNPNFPSRGALGISAARSDFDFAPTIDLALGIQQYHQWLESSEFWRAKL